MSKKIFILIFLYFFSTISVRADNIKDFQIEGISVGESLLKYYSKDFIENRKKYFYPKSDKYYRINTGREVKFNTYEAVQFQLLKNDKNYIIYSVSGLILYEENIEECYEFKKNIVDDLKSQLPNTRSNNETSKHNYDETGKSTVNRHTFWLDSGGIITVKCSDWNEDLPMADKLSVVITSKELLNFLQNEAY